MSARAESGSDFPSAAGASPAPAGEIGFDLPAWQRVGCLRDPCSPEPDPALFFASPELKQSRETLLATLRRDPASVCVVTGPAGSGKTMLLRELEAALAQRRLEAVYVNCADVTTPWHEQFGTAGMPSVLLLDGAELCGEPALDALEQWLTAGEGVRSGVRAVISGRPAVAARLQRLADAAAGAGLATASVALEPFDTFMVGEFLAHRLWRSGFTATWPLSNAALQRIADRSGGLPADIVRLAAPEFEAAWTAEAVFAPPRADPPPLALAPSASVPAVVPPPPAARRPPSGPALRTALLATVLLGVAGGAGWLAWRTVESARLAVGVADAAPPVTPHRSVVAIPPPVLTLKPLASEEPAMSTVPEAAPATGPAAPASPLAATATTAPLAIAEPAPPPSPAATESSVAAEAPRAIEPAPPVEPRPHTDSTAAVVAPTLALGDPPAESVPEARVTEAKAAAPAAVEPAAPLAAAPRIEPSPMTDQPVEPPAAAAEGAIALAALPAPASDADPPAAVAGSAASAPSGLAQAPTPPAADPPTADPPAAAPSPAPAAEPAGAPTPAAPAAPPPASIEPSAGAPPAAASPAPRLSPEQAASYVRRGDEMVRTGDIAGARLWYERAAAAGDPAAMQALGRTYDARMLRQWGVVGLPADPARAAQWYRKAAEAERAAPPRQ